MATSKVPKLQVILPKRLLKAASARQRPAEQAERDADIASARLFPVLNQQARNYRNSTNVIQLMRHLARAEGQFSTAIHNTVETAYSGFSVMAYNSIDHQFSPEGTALASTVTAMFNTVYDYTEGHTERLSMEDLLKQMLREALLTGGVASELVLNKASLPDRIQSVGFETIVWKSDGKNGAYPSQTTASEVEPVSLDIATFFTATVHADPGMLYPRSVMESAIKVLVLFEEFMDDIRRSIRVAGHNRMTVSLDAEKIKKSAPRSVQQDSEKLRVYMEAVQTAVQTQVESLDPEQALVFFDSAVPDVLQSGTGSKIDYTPLLSVFISQYATGMKTPPSVLGLRLESGSQALGNVETLIFLKSTQAIRTPVETVLSRMLTLACRLYGADVYVNFKFGPIDLRPETELEAFKNMRQTRLLELLSLGFLTDDEAAHMLGTGPRAPGAPPLSGTMFTKGGSQDLNTFPGDTAMGRTLQPDKDIPRKSGGKSQ